MQTISITALTGHAITAYIDDLAGLRIGIFRAYPYLYDGDLGYETRYLQTYAACPESLFVLAKDGDKVIGCSTGLPMANAEPEFQKPFVDAGYDTTKIFYFGESVLLPEYRGRGLGHRFFDEREAYARKLGRFEYCSFCAVQRPDDHPKKPPGYRPLDAFWQGRGYEKHDKLSTRYSWREPGDDKETAKPMTFWLRALDRR